MKAKILCSGFDGSKHYEPGDIYDGDGEWIRKCIVHGLAEPLDDAAQAVAASEDQARRYASPGLVRAAMRRGRKADDIPALKANPGLAKAAGERATVRR